MGYPGKVVYPKGYRGFESLSLRHMSGGIITIRNSIIGWLYRNILKPVLFLVDAEKVHGSFIVIGSVLGASGIGRVFTKWLFGYKNKALGQDISGIHFDNPIGLAAGFDYEGRLTGIIKSIGMGFATIGTITNLPYGGNPKPRLGRLIKSKSLLVNKGFKNLGIKDTLSNLQTELGCIKNTSHENVGKFLLPVGISIGKTNTLAHKTQEQGIEDICQAFKEMENINLSFSYYELNISCPNLQGNIEFYQPLHLEQLLKAVFALNLSKPVFIKMPITKTDEETLAMLRVIADSPAAGVIFGNLQNDRNDSTVLKEESDKYLVGNLSGMPTQKRSDQLIKLAYRNYGKGSIKRHGDNKENSGMINRRELIIIGCGGVFSAEDAYRKIRSGASLVQMITGMIFKGPQVISEINIGISKLLARDGFTHISQAIGADTR
jgi:dihydroorotate dehydrogenase